MLALKSESAHHVLKITVVDHLGQHDGGTAFVHKSRTCRNCDSFAPTNTENDWDSEADGPCINSCSAAGDDESGQFCPDHQTKAEFAAGLHRAHVPVFAVVKGGAA